MSAKRTTLAIAIAAVVVCTMPAHAQLLSKMTLDEWYSLNRSHQAMVVELFYQGFSCGVIYASDRKTKDALVAREEAIKLTPLQLAAMVELVWSRDMRHADLSEVLGTVLIRMYKLK